MTGHELRWLGFGLVASAGAGLLTLTSAMNPAFAYGSPVVAAAPSPDVTQVMNGSGFPIPSQSYIDAVNGLYIQPNMPGTTPVGLFTPEGISPLGGVKTLPLDTSVSQGVTILNDTISPQIAAGEPVGVFGYSQSAIISSLEMEQLQAAGVPPSAAQFAMIGDPMNPNGGFFERFAGLQLPSLGVTLYGATPSDAFPTDIYTLEYDAAADFPQYPIDLPADLNALAGFIYLHGTYPDLTPAEVGTAVQLPTTGGLTDYYMIPTDNLPLLDPLRAIPVVGNPLADLIQPDLTTVVNLGYGDPAFGWSQGPANVPTPFGLFPNVNPATVVSDLITGAQQGVQNFVADLSNPVAPALPSLPDLANGLAAVLGAAGAATTSPIDIVNTLTSVVSTDYAVLLPTADLALAAAVTLPAYDVGLFVDQLAAGDLINAVGYPIAADLGLGTMGGGLELLVLLQAALTTVTDLMSLIP